ncbi:MAG: hypothetical protein HC937_03300 [Aquincola sp.]|nr:hypothetical protein [Aquincola sp.]
MANACNGVATCAVQALSALCPMGDPAPTRRKLLAVDYRCGATVMPRAEAEEGKTLGLACPR